MKPAKVYPKPKVKGCTRRESPKAMGAFLLAPAILKPASFKPGPMPTTVDSLNAARAKAGLDSLSRLMKYRTALVRSDGSLFDGPRIKAASRDEAGGTTVLEVRDCQIVEQCSVNAIRLYDESGEFRVQMPFSGGSQHVCSGDTLKVTVTIYRQ